MNLNELYNENKNPFQDVVDKVAAKEKQADAEHTKGLKDIADKFQSAEKKSSEEFSKKLRADEAKDTHCSDKCCGSDVKAEDCNCPPTCKHCDCNAIVSESQLPQQGVAENNMPPLQQSSTQDTPQQAKVRAALEKGLQISDKNDADEVSRKTAQNDKRAQRLGPIAGASPEPVRREGGWNSRGIRAIVSIEPDGTIVADKSDYSDYNSLKQLLAWGGMAGAKIITTHEFKQKQGVAEGQFDPINDDDFYEYNVNTNKIVKRISGKHPIARQFSPMQKEWAGRDADHKIVKGMYAKQLKPTVDEKVSDYLPAPLVNKHSIVKGWRKAKGLDEKAPPGDKAERMVKHIKKNYSKDGKLTPTEKSIAYATAWKAHNAGKV